MEHKKSIIILDFGGQYAHLIARRVRQAGAFSEIYDADISIEKLQHAAGIILSGGPQSVYDPGSPSADPKIFDLGIPILGICYGLQWMTKQLGGEVTAGKTKEYGHTLIKKTGSSILFQDCPDKWTVWMSHGDEASKLPTGFERIAESIACTNAAFADEQRSLFAVQFHPEVVHTEYGSQILQRFVGLCKADPWSVETYAKRISEEIKKEVGDKNVFMLVSGGVDSTVAFTLLNSILGPERVQGLLVDTGLMRKNEIEEIQNAFAKLKITNLHIEDASEEFFENLKDVYDPEAKRKIIGQTFLDVQKRVSEKMNLKVEDGWMLGQGTIYPDTIETGGTKHADHIKTHHNRVEAIQKMIDAGNVIEPLKDLYKDEVRILGEELGLPHSLVWRHPFPGPGLGVRILCAETPQVPVTLGVASKNPFAILPVKSVGVQGDGRTYRHALSLFSDDPTTITDDEWSLAVSIPNKHPEVSRVLMCLSHSTPPTFVFTPGYITRERADLLREADTIVNEEMRKADLLESVWQFPVVLLPFGTAENGQSIVLRPITSQEAMTAEAVALPKQVLEKITERLLSLPHIHCVFIDLTHKPPGTIEWE